MNGQVRTLVHELVHALGVNYQTHTRPQAEVIVDTATLIILSGAGLDASGETIPYVAGWGESGALEAVTEHAELIDRLARAICEKMRPSGRYTLPGVIPNLVTGRISNLFDLRGPNFIVDDAGGLIGFFLLLARVCHGLHILG